MPVYTANKGANQRWVCPQCHNQMDKYGIHALSCINSGDNIGAHDQLAALVGVYARKAGLPVETNPRGSRLAQRAIHDVAIAAGANNAVPAGEDEYLEPGDIIVRGGANDGRDQYIDVARVNPRAKSYRKRAAKKRALPQPRLKSARSRNTRAFARKTTWSLCLL